jgi:hydrogenase 3 maturation protease
MLRSDDGAGVYICRNINQTNNIKVLTVEVSIENYIKKINDLNPDILILVDCVDFNKKPGYYDLLPVEKIKDFTTGTHNISLKRVSEFFKMKVLVLGIQPATLVFGEKLSSQVKESAERITNKINDLIKYF